MSRAIAVVGHGSRFQSRFDPSLAAADLQVVAVTGIESLQQVQSSTDIDVIVISLVDGTLAPQAGTNGTAALPDSLLQLLDADDLERTMLISDQDPAPETRRPKMVLPEDVSVETLLFCLSGMVPPIVQRRQDERFLASIQVQYRCGPAPPPDVEAAMTETTLSNLSLGGAFVRSLNPPPVGTRIYLELEMSADYPPLALNGRVVYQVVADLERGIVLNPADPDHQLTAHPGFAVVFDGSSFEARSMLQRLLRDIR